MSSPSRSDADVIVDLLTEALAALEVDPAKAGRAIRLARRLASGAAPEANPATSGRLEDWRMRRALEFVHGNLAERLRIQQVAAVLNVSAGYLSRAFKAAAGMTYSDYVARARIALAKRLLLTTDMPISEIALACGAHDQPYLTRVFKRAVGMTPAAWRRQYGSASAGVHADAFGDDPKPGSGFGAERRRIWLDPLGDGRALLGGDVPRLASCAEFEP